MSPAARPRRNNNQRRRSNSNQSGTVNLWRVAGPMPELQAIQPSSDVTAMLRSLGEPPLLGGTDVGGYFETVVERAAAMAAALALSVDLLDQRQD